MALYHLLRSSKIYLFLTLFILLQFSHVQSLLNQSNKSDRVLSKTNAKNILEFSSKVFKALADDNSNKNVLFSPLSLGTVLGFLHQYVKNSEHMQNMNNAMSMPNTESKKSYEQIVNRLKEIDMVNILVSNGEINQKKLIDSFKMKFYPKFNAKQINEEISQVTKNKINNVVSDDKNIVDDYAFLINAIHYKGVWLKPFSPDGTKVSKFNKNLDVQFMHQEEDFCVGSNKFKWINLPLHNQYTMTIIIPSQGNTLDSVIKDISPNLLNKIHSTCSENSVVLKMPKFTVKATTDLNVLLNKLGLDFMSKEGIENIRKDKKPMILKSSKQTAFMEVNEVGASGAAATVLEFNALRIKETFNVDQPFIAIISENENNIPILMAKIVDPTK